MKSLLFQIKSQLNQREFKVTFALLYVLSIGAVVWNCVKYYSVNYMEIRSAADNFLLVSTVSRPIKMIFTLVFPLLSATLYSGYRKNNEKNGNGLFSLLRMNRNKYIIGNAIVVTVMTFLSLFGALMLNQLLCCIAFPIDGYDNNFGIPQYALAMNYDKGLLLEFWQMQNPYIYNLLYALIVSILGSGIGLVAYGLGLVDKFEKIKAINISIVVFVFFILLMILGQFADIQMLSFLTYIETGHRVGLSEYLAFVLVIYAMGIVLTIKGSKKYEYI